MISVRCDVTRYAYKQFTSLKHRALVLHLIVCLFWRLWQLQTNNWSCELVLIRQNSDSRTIRFPCTFNYDMWTEGCILKDDCLRVERTRTVKSSLAEMKKKTRISAFRCCGWCLIRSRAALYLIFRSGDGDDTRRNDSIGGEGKENTPVADDR